jgi:hypothetical protein
MLTRHVGKGSVGLQQDNAGPLATHIKPLQCSADLLPTYDGQLQCQMVRQLGVASRMHVMW